MILQVDHKQMENWNVCFICLGLVPEKQKMDVLNEENRLGIKTSVWLLKGK